MGDKSKVVRKKVVRRHKLTDNQVDLLLFLSRHKGIKPPAIMRKFKIEPSPLYYHLKILEGREYIKRGTQGTFFSPSDSMIYITKTGRIELSDHLASGGRCPLPVSTKKDCKNWEACKINIREDDSKDHFTCHLCKYYWGAK